MRVPNVGLVLKLAKARLTERRRQVASSPKLGGAIAAIVVGLTYILVNPGGRGAYYYGQQLEAGNTDTVYVVGRQLFVTIGALALLLYVFRGATSVANYENSERFEELHLPAHVRVAGVYLAEALQLVFIGLIPTVATAVSFAAGSGDPSTGASILVVGLWLGFTLPFAGLTVGLSFNSLLASRLQSGRLKVVAGGICILAYSGLVTQRQAFVPWVADSPLGAPATLAMAGIGGTFEPLWLVLPGISAATYLCSVGVGAQIALLVWRPAQRFPTGEEPQINTRTDTTVRRIRDLPDRYRRLALLSHLTVRNTVRSPSVLLYAGLPIAGLGLVGYGVAIGYRSAWLLPIVAITAGVVAIGSSFTLNLLGTNSRAIPWLFTGVVRPREFVLGSALPVLLLGVPLFVTASVAAGVVAAYSLVQLLAVTVLSIGSLTTAALLSVAAGLRFPNRRQTKLGSAGSISLPSRIGMLSIGGYAFIVALLGVVVLRDPTFRGQLLAGVTPILFSVCIVTVLQYSATVLERGPMELLETRQYPPFQQTLTPRLAAFWDLVAVLAMVVGSSAVLGLSLLVLYGELSEVPPSLQVSSTLAAYSLASIAYLVRHPSSTPSFSLPSRRSLATIVLGVGVLIGIGVTSTLLGTTAETPTSGSGLANANWSSVFLLGVVVAPVVEELLFRGIVQDRLLRAVQPRYAIAIASAPFALAHLVTASSSVTIAAVMGAIIWLQSVVLGTAYYRSETLVVPLAIHVGYNAVAFLPAFL
jgi:membrane protease YdiL (CAAX protease family)